MLSRRSADQLRALQPGLQGRVLAVVREAMRGQGRSLTGGQGHGLALGVETAVAALVAGAGEAELAATRRVFTELGRTEYREGHRVDALRSILVVGTQAIWSWLVERPGPLTPDELYGTAAALFGYVDALAGAAAEGYLDEQRDAAHDWATVRRRLITLLVQPGPPADAALHAAAEAARWPLPLAVAVISAEGTDADHLASAIGGGAIATVIDGATRIVTPAQPPPPGRSAKAGPLAAPAKAGTPAAPARPGLAAAPAKAAAPTPPSLVVPSRGLTGRRAAVGPVVPLRQARTSYRISRRALDLQQAGRLPDGVLACDDHLVPLMLAWEPGVADRLAEHVLAPLAALPPGTRRPLAATLLAWLRAQGQVIPAAAALHTHPQTVRYRMKKLRDLFGERLEDPDERLALQLALTAAG
ncbi:helix-turn-helix domain-containing protein [Dactylosporangium sp. NPDC005572]|uniref:PucR family transcriptional regulator n=1 Tax=Dactylosporangium sp. NPDC005572 TaxID=3156889 RepID=UPI0033BD771C